MRLSKALPVFALLLLPLPALAQEVPTNADIALWCGHAFAFESSRRTDDIGAQLKTISDVMLEGGRQILTDAGFDATQVALVDGMQKAAAEQQIAEGASAAKYTFEQCDAIIEPVVETETAP